MYQALKASRSTFVPIRHLPYHVRQWGEPVAGQAPLVLVHGWMDVSASWQFMVDALKTDRWIIAPDWRGFGLTKACIGAGPPQTDAGLLGGQRAHEVASVGATCPAPDSYWFPDYLADLDALLDHFAGEQAVDLVGHSMGGNVAMMFAGVRPQRIRRLVNLEGFGLPATRPTQAPERYAKWMDEIKALHRGEMDLKPYESAEGVARRLMKTNPRLPQDKADWLAQHWAAPDAQGRWQILGDPAHKVVSAHLYQVEEALAIYRRIAAPVLSVTASDDSLGQWWKDQFTLAQYHERLQAVPSLQNAVIHDAAHMLHHDQPQALATLIENFLG
jgi:pimeloyl-ACP methyl ester carboxylesterase